MVIALALLPFAFLAIIWPALPLVVPVHYDAHFNPDKMGSKNILWLTNGLLSLISIAVYFLLVNLNRIDPKRRKQAPFFIIQKDCAYCGCFIAVLNLIILLSAGNYIKFSPKLLFVLVSLLITFMGNYMNNLKPNYFAGLRLPWTLNSDYNWKKTHHLASKMWFWGGLLMVILIIFFPSSYSFPFFFSILGILVITPVLYSYRLFKEEN